MPRPETGSEVFIYKTIDKIVPFLCKHKVHPNYITLVGCSMNFLLISNITPSYKILALVINRILDALDGEVARKCDMKSKFGSYLDAACDALTVSVIILSIVGINPSARNILITFVGLFIIMNCVGDIDDHSMPECLMPIHDNLTLVSVLAGYFAFYHPGSMKFMLP